MSEWDYRKHGDMPVWRVLFDTMGFEESDLDLDAIREAAKDPGFDAQCETMLQAVIDTLSRMPRDYKPLWLCMKSSGFSPLPGSWEESEIPG